MQNNRLDKEYYSLNENELLTKKVIDGGHEFRAIYLPSVLIFQVLWTAHDDLGRNGFSRTYAALKRVFFWKGMKVRHQGALQDLCNMPITQTREREIQEENFQAITSTHGFHLHGLNR